MTWRASDHSDGDNVQWCWLRAVEWGRWPLFLSQSVAPVLLIWFPWEQIVLFFWASNIVWAICFRYSFVSVHAAWFGAAIVLLRWISWPAASVYLLIGGSGLERWVALGWPLIVFALGIFPPTDVGRIQRLFLQALGYESIEGGALE